MTEDIDGFLAESLDHVRAVVREKYADWRSLLGHVNRLAVANQHLIVIHRDNAVEWHAALLFARTLATIQASILVLEAGLIAQARILQRSALETFFSLAALAKEPGFVDKLIEGHEAEQKNMMKKMKLWESRELRQIAEAASASDQWEHIRGSTANSLSTLDIAKAAGLEEWYRSVYMVFSWSVHGATVDLKRHVVVNADGEATEFQNEPEIEGQGPTWFCAIKLLLEAMTALALVFPEVDQGSLDEYHTYADELALKAEAEVDGSA
jgi:hypothetical protein